MFSNICRINFKKSIVLNKVHDKQRNLRKYCKGPNVHVCALYIYCDMGYEYYSSNFYL